MADKPQASEAVKRFIDRDVVQVEFLIDDLIKQLAIDTLRPVANCNGCNSCSAVADRVKGRE